MSGKDIVFELQTMMDISTVWYGLGESANMQMIFEDMQAISLH